MERLYYAGKAYLTQFKLDLCCWFAPVRVGLFIIGYLNIVIDLIYMMGIANGGMAPTIVAVQNELIEDNVTVLAPIAAYAVESGFNVVLLCGLHRRDLVLMRVFMYYTIFAVVLSFLTYSMVLAAVTIQIQLAIIISTLFQMYSIVLVRSEMVEMKMERKKHQLPTLVMSSLPSSYEYNVKNGQIHEVTVTEVPKPQQVQIAVIGLEDKIKDIEIKKDTKDKAVLKDNNETEIKTDRKYFSSKKDTPDAETKKDIKVKIEKNPPNVEVKKDAEVKVVIESTGKDANIIDVSKGDKKSKEEKKLEEKRIKEEKKKEEKRLKEEKKLEKKKIKEVKTINEGKTDKEENTDKQEEKAKKIKEEKTGKEMKTINEGKTDKEENTDKQEEKANESNKEVKEKWLQAVPENPKE